MSDQPATVTIATFPSEVEAEVAQSILAANAIDAIVLTDNAGGMLPSMHLLKETRLVVRAEDAEAARAVLQEGE